MSAAWVYKLNESNARTHKEDVIKQLLSMAVLGSAECDRCLDLINQCYHPMITFGVKQVPETIGIVDADNPWGEFAELLNQLRLRQLTGHDARDAIEAISQRFDSDNWNDFCAAVIRKDLRCGISDKTINKICKGTKYQVPVFSCQLASSCEGRPEMVGKKRLEPKLDGVRVLMWCAISGPGDLDIAIISFSRNGKVFDNFGVIESEIANRMRTLSSLSGHSSFILDGEIVGKSFNELMRVARKKNSAAAADDSVFHVFDFIPMEDFKRGHWNAQLHKRLAVLDKIGGVIAAMPHVQLLDSIEVDLDVSEGRDQLERYAKDCVAAGYEGIMIKNLDAPYECKRNTFWLKWKPVITVDLQIKGIEIGTGRNADRMGAFVCEGVDGDKHILVNVGSGVSDEERVEYWENRDSLVGRTVEIMCDTISQNQDGTYSLRFPRFVRFRDTLTGEKE